MTIPPLESREVILHIKIVPRYNDEQFIQHADDQINNGFDITGEPHEVPGYPIGHAIESYQGFYTCEIWYEEILDVSPYSGSGLILYAEEDLCERHKIIYLDPSPIFLRFLFRLRTELGSSYYIDVNQYVYIVNHENCGDLGGPDTDNPMRAAPTTTAAPTTLPHVTTLQTTTASVSTSATTAP